MKIFLAGDLFLGGDLYKRKISEAIRLKKFNESDIRIVNLEQPISDNDNTAEKCTLYTGSYAINQIVDLKIDSVCLANNHMQDKGIHGITETIEHLSSCNIGFFGSGKDIVEAKKPYWVDDKLAVFGYCEYGKSYLNQVEVADESRPGVSPLGYEEIVEDLNKLKGDERAILFIHWGREHVFLPPLENLELAKKLLRDDRVALIVGTHPHRIQGYWEFQGKRAYMSVGNFLFPNFYMKPPAQIFYPENMVDTKYITRQYHSVEKITYKKWKFINRLSIVLVYDTQVNLISHDFSFQSDDYPVLNDVSLINRAILESLVLLLSCIYRLPRPIYYIFEIVNSKLVKFLWKFNIYIFKLKQLGLVNFCRRIISRVSRFLDG